MTLALSLALLASLDLDPFGVTPWLLDEGRQKPPVLARTPFLVTWQRGWLCAGAADTPEPTRCAQVGAHDGSGVAVRRLGDAGIVVMLDATSLAVLSRNGVLYVARDVVDVYFHDDAMQVGVRVGPDLAEDVDLRVVDGALQRKAGGPVRRVGDPITAGLPVAIEGRPGALLVIPFGRWGRSGVRASAITLADPARGHSLSAALSRARVDARGHIAAEPKTAADARAIAAWVRQPVVDVRGSSPLIPPSLEASDPKSDVDGSITLGLPCGVELRWAHGAKDDRITPAADLALLRSRAFCILPMSALTSTEQGGIAVAYESWQATVDARVYGDLADTCSALFEAAAGDATCHP